MRVKLVIDQLIGPIIYVSSNILVNLNNLKIAYLIVSPMMKTPEDGNNEISFDASKNSSRAYFCNLQVGNFVETK